MIKYFVAGDYAPVVSTDGSGGIDLFANSISDDKIHIGTGVHVQIPENHVGLLLPRSSWGVKGLMLANTCGVIDSDYRGEVKVVRDYHPTKGHLNVKDGDKIIQMIVVPCVTDISKVDSLEDLNSTDRNDGGFGSTGG
tara:strand:+ start:318 stop:731 length:414 start_codon:yes stop_codon:yes gene_type:complete